MLLRLYTFNSGIFYSSSDMGILGMPSSIASASSSAIASSSDSSSGSTSSFSTVYPVVQPIVTYEVPINSNFGSGIPVGSGVGGGIPNVGNFQGIGPNHINDEELFMYENLPVKSMTSENSSRKNRLKYNTIYMFKTTAELKEYKNSNWNSIVFRSIRTKDYKTEKNPSISNNSNTSSNGKSK